MPRIHAPAVAFAAAACFWAGSAEAARYYEITLKGELVSELGYGPWELNTGVDQKLAVGNIVTLTARFNADRAFDQGGGFVAGLYGLPTGGVDFVLAVRHGHTDDVGSDAVNQRISEQRANAVASYLMAQGVQRERLETVGMGKRFPIADNATEQGRARNRRVEIRLLPLRS